MTLNVKNIEDRMQLMHDNELQQFAAMHKNDPYVLPLALQEADRRKKYKVAEGMKFAGQQQPTVADQALQQMSPQPAPQQQQQPMPPQAGMLPEEQGIGTLPAQNMVGMADGGIAGYADGGTPKAKFNPDMYLNNPNVQRYLQYINAYEGFPAPNQLVKYKQFNDYSDHPRTRVKFGKDKNQVSTAAGSFQMLARTWDEQQKKLGLTDFSPENQARAAIGILRDKGALNDVVKGNFEAAKEKTKNVWASLPGSTIGKETKQIPKLKPAVEKFLVGQAPLIDPRTGTMVAEAGLPGIPTAAPARTADATQAVRRAAPIPEEKYGLSKDLAALVNRFMPGSEARAGELPPVQAQRPVVIPSAAPNITERGSSLSGKIDGPAVRAVPPAKVSDKNRLDTAAPGILALPSMLNPKLGSALTQPIITDIPAESEEAYQLRKIDEPNAVRRPATKRTEPSPLERFGTNVLGAPEAFAGTVTGMVAPWTAALPYGLSKITGQPKTYEEAMRDVTYAPRTASGQEALDTTYQALEASKLPPFMPGIAVQPGRGPKKLIGETEQAGRAARLAEAQKAIADAELRKAAKEGKGQGELFNAEQAPVPADAGKVIRSRELTDLEQAQRDAIDAQRARGAQQEMFTPEEAPVPPAISRVMKPRNPILEKAQLEHERRSNVRAGIEDLRLKGEEARAKQREMERIKAGENVESGKRQLGKQAEDRRVFDEITRENAIRDQQAKVLGVGSLGVRNAYDAEPSVSEPETSGIPPSPEPIDLAAEAQAWRDRYKKGPETFDTQVEDASKTKAAGAALAPQAKEGTGLTNDDYLTMGLNMLQAGPGTGNTFSDLASNVGRSGLATLASRKEREKLAADKLFKDVYSKYYTGMTEQLGKPTGEERSIQRYADDPKYAAAYDAMQGVKNDRLNIATLVGEFEKARLYNPALRDITFDEWMRANKIGSAGTPAINPNLLPLIQQYTR